MNPDEIEATILALRAEGYKVTGPRCQRCGGECCVNKRGNPAEHGAALALHSCPDCVNGAAGSGPLSPRHNLAESRGDAMTPEEQIAWLREEVTLQTGASPEALDEAMRAPGHMPVVNLRMGVVLRKGFSERAAVVAWLRRTAAQYAMSSDPVGTGLALVWNTIAEQIETGEHLKEKTP